MRQTPDPGSRRVVYAGDIVVFSLELPRPAEGTAFLRTTLGRAPVQRSEVIRHIEQDSPALAADWHDLPMKQAGPNRYTISVPVFEPGRFEAKALFLPKDSIQPDWPAGENVVIKVEPAAYCCSNTIYTAFVRQFGPNKSKRKADYEPEMNRLESEGYSVIPKSGTFRDLARELDFITGTLGFRIIQLLPIFPTPTVYARMGRFGSPFAALDLMDVDPALADFDRRTTPLDQFQELVDAIHAREARVFLDVPANHTGWASRLQTEHPDWFVRKSDNTFMSPGAWGVEWADLSKLDYSNKDLWRYMAEVFLFWRRRGVDGFRCDAGYMLPLETWRYVIAKVRDRFPDTIFLLEGLGGKLSVTESLLDYGNMDWAYSELFQNYDRGAIERLAPLYHERSQTFGTQIHFAETHDNNRLASVSKDYSHMRLALSALLSHRGGFGMTGGVEWFADEKINVHGASGLNWGAAENQVDWIKRLNALLDTHPVFVEDGSLDFLPCEERRVLVALRKSVSGGTVIVVVNLDDASAAQAIWPSGESKTEGTWHDLLTGNSVQVEESDGRCRIPLERGAALCLSREKDEPCRLEDTCSEAPAWKLIEQQRARALAASVWVKCKPEDPALEDISDAARELLEDPAGFCFRAAGLGFPPVTTWRWPEDLDRVVILPPDDFLIIYAESRFSADILYKNRTLHHDLSLPCEGGAHFVLVPPLPCPGEHRELTIRVCSYESGKVGRREGRLCRLCKAKDAVVDMSPGAAAALADDNFALLTNGRGGMAQAHAGWAEISSQYDAFLAANLDPEVPVDRTVMLTRCRAWLSYQGYSQEINRDCLLSFSVTHPGTALWRFTVPSGNGKFTELELELQMAAGGNSVTLEFRRNGAKHKPHRMEDEIPVRIIVRPDIEDRQNHSKTKAFMGAETAWPKAVLPRQDGFNFNPGSGHVLDMRCRAGRFVSEPEWMYMTHHPLDRERGQDDCSDLFSPGWFFFDLAGGSSASIEASAFNGGERAPRPATEALPYVTPGKRTPLRELMLSAIRQFVVRRGESKTVIAGYPWFLDWGRDTLIALRGIIAAGMHDEARSILLDFARFESDGTLPNMIRGRDASNRDTSDAPLWLFPACRDLAGADSTLLTADCSGRSLKDVLVSIAGNYIAGTPNGIKADKDSGLVFSPSHFTWMDTNYPAGTPREGYPIEIQALWLTALRYLSTLDTSRDWASMAERVGKSIMELYPVSSECGIRRGRFLSDCLHAGRGQPAREAEPDDHLRPNQLLAVTLGAVPDSDLCKSILAECEALLVPGAMRSLADRPVRYRLPVSGSGGLLNDPARPYKGQYTGDEDTSRKPAYHNGTAWTWIMPSYAEALVAVYGASARDKALALLGSSSLLAQAGCLGQIPEVLDGSAPHRQRGCGAQAWGATELYRVLANLAECC